MRTILVLSLGLVLSGCSLLSKSNSDKDFESRVTGIEIGNIAPNIIMDSPDGKAISLASLKGQLVLIDFWASWCGPCRKENPNLVRSYEKYHDAKFTNGKGFTIYSVSLDKTKNRWIGAIEADNLSWDYHVSDLQGWENKAAKAYGVRSIPSNLLIDGNGVILAKNLRGQALDKAIDTYLVSFGKN